MRVLKAKELYDRLQYLMFEMGSKEFEKLPVVIGDDEELNGVHYGFYCEAVDRNDKYEYEWLDADNIGENKFILIS